MSQLLLWFAGEYLAPKAADAALQRLRDRGWTHRLAKRVGDRTPIRFSLRRLRKWLRSPETARALVFPSIEELAKVATSLIETLWPKDPPPDVETLADDLLSLVVTEFLAALDASEAIAVSHFREAQALTEIQDQTNTIVKLLKQDHSFADLLEGLPPNVRIPLLDLAQVAPKEAHRLVSTLSGTNEPVKAIGELTAEPPDWLDQGSFLAWVAVAEFASAHRVEDVAVSAFIRVAELGSPDRTLWLGRAALLETDSNPNHSRALAERARALSPKPHRLIEVVEGVLREDWKAVRESSRNLAEGDRSQRILGLALKASAEFALQLWDEAIASCDAVLELEPLHSSIAIHKARTLLARAIASTPESRDRALEDAYRLALRARDNRRTWKGPSAEAVDLACQVSILRGDWEAVIRLASGPPAGEALPSEEEDDPVRAKLAASSISVGRVDVAERAIGVIGDPFEKAFLQGLLNEKLNMDPQETRAQYREAYEVARSDEQRAAAQQALAFLGEWPLPGLEDHGFNNSQEVDLSLATSEAMRGDLPAAVRRLRRLLPTSLKATNLLALLYDQAGETASAVEVLKAGYSRYNDGSLLLRAAEVLANAGDIKAAESSASEALAVTTGPIKRRARGLLLTLASERNDWNGVEVQCRALIGEGDERPTTRWALALSLFNQGKQKEAWDGITRPPELEPLEELHAQFLIQLQRRFGHAPEAVKRVLSVASQYPDSEQVGAAAIMAAIEISADTELPGELVQQLQQTSAKFFELFPESQFLSRRSFTTPEDFAQQIRDLFPEAADREAEYARVAQQIANEGYPYGILSALVGRAYSEALLRRAGGCLPVVSPNDSIVAEEQAAAAQFLNSKCLVDISTFHTLSTSPDLWALIAPEFQALLLPQISLRDLLIARDALALRSTASVSWDPTQDRIRLSEISQEEADDLAKRAEWMVKVATSLQLIQTNDLINFPDLNPDRFAAWLTPLDQAKEQGFALFCDDVGLRLLAKGMNVPAFGSFAVLSTLQETGRANESHIEGFLFNLTRAYGVDLPPNQTRLVDAARADSWEPRGAAFALSRPKFWTSSEALSIFQTLLGLVGESAPDFLPNWVYAGLLGCVRAAQDAYRHDVAGTILAFALLEAGIPRGRVPRIVEAARKGAEELGIDDPLEPALTQVSKRLEETYGSEAGSRIFIGSVASLGEEDRLVAMRALLSRDQSLAKP